MTPFTKTLALWAFVPLLAASTLLPLTAHPASAVELSSENRGRDADIAAQGGVVRPPLAALPRIYPMGRGPRGFEALPTPCLHTHLDHGSC